MWKIKRKAKFGFEFSFKFVVVGVILHREQYLKVLVILSICLRFFPNQNAALQSVGMCTRLLDRV